jgi:hypothetical protein
MSMSDSGANGTEALAAPAPQVDDVPPSGQVPAHILQNGGQARIPLWPIHADELGESDRLVVYWRRDGVVSVVSDQTFQGPIQEQEFVIALPRDLWSGDGVAYLYYLVRPVAPPGNRLYSLETELFIDHSVIPLPELLPAAFPDADSWGYLNCTTSRPIWNGVFINIPYQGFQVNDECFFTWRAYTSLNAASGTYIEGTEGVFTHRLSNQEAENVNGFELPPIPFAQYLEPLLHGSGTARYRIRRAGSFIGESRIGLVRVDRYIPGEPLPCGPP